MSSRCRRCDVSWDEGVICWTCGKEGELGSYVVQRGADLSFSWGWHPDPADMGPV